VEQGNYNYGQNNCAQNKLQKSHASVVFG